MRVTVFLSVMGTSTLSFASIVLENTPLCLFKSDSGWVIVAKEKDADTQKISSQNVKKNDSNPLCSSSIKLSTKKSGKWYSYTFSALPCLIPQITKTKNHKTHKWNVTLRPFYEFFVDGLVPSTLKTNENQLLFKKNNYFLLYPSLERTQQLIYASDHQNILCIQGVALSIKIPFLLKTTSHQLELKPPPKKRTALFPTFNHNFFSGFMREALAKQSIKDCDTYRGLLDMIEDRYEPAYAHLVRIKDNEEAEFYCALMNVLQMKPTPQDLLLIYTYEKILKKYPSYFRDCVLKKIFPIVLAGAMVENDYHKEIMTHLMKMVGYLNSPLHEALVAVCQKNFQKAYEILSALLHIEKTHMLNNEEESLAILLKKILLKNNEKYGEASFGREIEAITNPFLRIFLHHYFFMKKEYAKSIVCIKEIKACNVLFMDAFKKFVDKTPFSEEKCGFFYKHIEYLTKASFQNSFLSPIVSKIIDDFIDECTTHKCYDQALKILCLFEKKQINTKDEEETSLKISHLFFLNGNYQKSLEKLSSLKETAFTQQEKGKCLLELNKYDEALSYFQEAGTPESLEKIACIFILEKKYQKAIIWLKKCLDLLKGPPLPFEVKKKRDLILKIWACYTLLDQFKEREDFLKNHIKFFEQHASDLKNLCTKNPKNIEQTATTLRELKDLALTFSKKNHA